MELLKLIFFFILRFYNKKTYLYIESNNSICCFTFERKQIRCIKEKYIKKAWNSIFKCYCPILQRKCSYNKIILRFSRFHCSINAIIFWNFSLCRIFFIKNKNQWIEFKETEIKIKYKHQKRAFRFEIPFLESFYKIWGNNWKAFFYDISFEMFVQVIIIKRK